jgi:2,3-bisphosphoglycerate-dependent phosphoglycerate mutase
LNPEGKKEALRTSKELKDIKFDAAYTSVLRRAKETLSIIIKELKIKIPMSERWELNERNYGIYTGKNKWEIKEKYGEAEFMKIRRSWDYPIEAGESLKQVYSRVIPFYESEILPLILREKNILIAASGNSLRALVKYLENIKDADISEVEIHTGEAWVYDLDKKGKMLKKEIRAKNDKVV